MPEVLKARIREAALSLLKGAPEGMRYKALHASVCAAVPEASPNTVASELHTLRHLLPPGSVTRGLYRHPGAGAN